MKEQDYSKINKYLEGELTKEEAQEVTHLIATQSDWKEAYAQEKLLVDMVRVKAAADFRKRLDRIQIELEEDPKEEAAVVKMPRRRWLAIAASILLPVALGISWMLTQGGNSLESTLAEVYDPSAEFSSMRGNNDGQEAEVQEAYESKDFARLVALLGTMEENAQNTVRKGIGHLELGQFAEAEQQFNEAIAFSDAYRYTAQWYLAITYLKQDKIPAASPILKELAETQNAGGKLRERAKVLLDEIE
ncbi:MAG: hypothetical protein AAFQ98_04420 [Bacteroidota bacterium]